MATNSEDFTTEQRGPCPKEIVDVLDAFCSARRVTRTELVNRILGKWVSDRLHEANVLERVTRGNPKGRESAYADLE